MSSDNKLLGVSGGSLRYARYRTDYVWSVNQPFAYRTKNGAATNVWPASTVWFQCFPSRTHCNQIHVKTSCTTMGGKKEQNCSRWRSRRPSNELLVRLRHIIDAAHTVSVYYNLGIFVSSMSAPTVRSRNQELWMERKYCSLMQPWFIGSPAPGETVWNVFRMLSPFGFYSACWFS